MRDQELFDLVCHRIDALLENDELTAEQRAEHDRLAAERDRLAAAMRAGDDRAATRRKTQHDSPQNVNPTGYGPPTADTRPADTWVDESGRRVKMLDPGESYAAHWRAQGDNHDQPRLSLGKAVVGMISGNWKNAQAEAAALDTHGGSGGHYLIPESMSAEIIDLARAKTVCVAAGARTIPMGSDRLVMARVLSDPALESKSENARFSGSGVSFGAIGFTSHTIGQVVTLSRELAQDAPNAPQLIENALAAALGNTLDRLMLLGDGSQEAPLLGLAVHEGVGKTESVGAVDWLDLHDGVVAIENANGTPNAFVCSPTIRGDLATLTTGDGTNAAKTWLGPPATVAPLSPFVTTACPDDCLFVGSFEQAVFAVRQHAELHVSAEADGAFQRNQIKIRITWRGDIGFLRPDWFYRLEGITT